MESISRYDFWKVNENRFDGVIRLIVLTVVSFFVVYNVRIIGLPRQLTSARLGVIFLFGWAVISSGLKVQIKKTACVRQYMQLIVALVGFALFGMFAVMIHGGGQGLRFSDNALEFILVWTLSAYAMSKLFKSLNEFFGVLLVITIIQSLLIVLCIMFKDFRLFINSNFNSLSYWNDVRDAEEMFEIGYAYGIGCMTSTGSLQLSLGALSALYFLLCKKKHKIMYLILFLFMTIVSVMVARSGLLFNGIILVFFVIHHFTPKRVLKVVLYLLVIVLLLSWLIYASPWAELIMSRMNRLVYLLTNGLYESFFVVYDNQNTHIPPLSESIFIGTGFTSGFTNSGYRVNVDGGYLRMYSALGLIGVIALYGVIISKTAKCVKKFRGSALFLVGLCALCLILVGEAKEQHILGYMLSLIFVFFFLAEQELDQENKTLD